MTFGAPSAGAVSSNVAVSFGPATGNNWPTVKAFSVVDANTSGNILYFTTITSQNIRIDNSLSYGNGNITITLT